ncbi:MAG TPA: GNAT family N-acetyltransferase [Isosphaeraceae bacterium]|nr:GNAT family N-acetyltransferase [Isosphaeraceae bacterium]
MYFLGDDGEKLTIRHRPMSFWSLLDSAPETASIDLRQAWQALLEASEDLFAIYQSPFWFDTMREDAGSPGAPHALAVSRDADHRLVGIVPLFVTRERCVFPLIRGHVHTTSKREVITLPSGRLLLPPGAEGFDALLTSLAGHYPNGPTLKIENIPIPSPLHDYLHSSNLIRQRYFLHEVPYLDRVHTIPLPASYDAFLARYSAKKRYNLRRQLRLLQERTGNRLAMRRYDSVASVEELVASYEALSQNRHEEAEGEEPLLVLKSPGGVACLLRRLARGGLLRAYVLEDGERPISCLLAAQFGGTFVLRRTLHDPAYNALSPGVALMHMAIEDLIKERPARVVNLGYGSREHDAHATHIAWDFVSYWLIPKTWRSRLFLAGYKALRCGAHSLKTAVRRGEASQPPAATPSE